MFNLSQNDLKITKIDIHDVRFPTSKELDGSDAMNHAPDYSAASIVMHTSNPDIQGHGMTFTLGRGNEICVKAIESLSPMVLEKNIEDIVNNFGEFWSYLTTSDSQLRWIGPEKGAIHLATAAIVNAIWDIWAKAENKPLWELVTDFTPEEFVSCIDFKYISDAISPDEALAILRNIDNTKGQRKKELLDEGYPAYTTSAGWLGYSDEKLRSLLRDGVSEGWNFFKLKVGTNLQDDIRRCRIVREEIGPDKVLMIDANQVWDVREAIDWVNELKEFNPWFIEEPTSPDDILGHLAIKKEVHPIKVATGEHCHNRVMFKQFFQSNAIDICQLDSCRLGGVNEVLAVFLLAAKFDIPVCPHAGGVGLCEHVQHLSMIDFISISGKKEGRVLEYVDHLHEHFKYPCLIDNGSYMPPKDPGYSTEMYKESINRFSFPHGPEWK
jgi:L-fuconate dehydratase